MLNIYLTNLGKYNEGVLMGEWVELPISDSELEEVKARIGIDDEYYEEMFITDYETDVDGLKVDEYDNIDYLNELATLAEDEPEKVSALIYFGYDTPEEIEEHLDDVNYVTEPEGSESEDFAIGYCYAHEYDCLDIPDNLEPYFDYEAYGRDIRLYGQFYTADNGAIYELAC